MSLWHPFGDSVESPFAFCRALVVGGNRLKDRRDYTRETSPSHTGETQKIERKRR